MPSGDGDDRKERKKKSKKKHHKHSSPKKRKREESGEGGDDEAAKQRRLVEKARAYLKEQEKKKKKKDKEKEKDKKKHKEKEKDKKKKDKKEKKGKGEEDDDGLPPRRPIPERLNAEDDYYRRQTEFRVWLRMVKKANFETLTREEAQKQFEKFVDKWNKAQLDDMYYDGIPAHLQQQCHKTAHQWGFTNKLSEEDKFDLERTADRITALTAQRPPGSEGGSAAASSSMARAGGGMTAAEAQYAREMQQERARDERRAVGKVVRDKRREVAEDATGGKATGREAMLAARQAKADRLHGAARAREEARDGLDVSESTLLGGDDREEIRRRVARQQERGKQRAEERERRIEEMKRQEEEKMKTLLDTLGLKPGQKIVIPKRTDG